MQTADCSPDKKLPAERQLAEELGCRTSVREAIQKLTSQGVLSARRGDGTPCSRSTSPQSGCRKPMVPLAA